MTKQEKLQLITSSIKQLNTLKNAIKEDTPNTLKYHKEKAEYYTKAWRKANTHIEKLEAIIKEQNKPKTERYFLFKKIE